MGESGGSSGGVFLCNLDYMYASNWKSMVLKLQAQEELLACFLLEAYVDFGYGQIWRLIAYCGVARSRKELEVRLEENIQRHMLEYGAGEV
ncbi:hypothetical protein V6N11_059517 [Hibiscus sabdariffa]|uniref:Uncharacterized protein n=1 Tax=Hibiscus sabdariffa TaxID=183260 RepID=A0ABR2ACV7_9ROSI